MSSRRYKTYVKRMNDLNNKMSSRPIETLDMRILKHMREFYEDEPEGIYIIPDEDNSCQAHALIIGPPKTPYENGFFYFVLNFPNDYPLKPPNVKLMTTNQQTVRFSPNLCASGIVRLSIIGTCEGPSWCPEQSILSTLLSIQILMNQHPYHNELGYEKGNVTRSLDTIINVQKNVSDYDDVITHETMRIAVIQMLEENSVDAFTMPSALKEVMAGHFKTHFQFYEKLIQSKLQYDGMPIRDPHGDDRPKTFAYKKMLEKMVELKEKFNETEDIGTFPIYDEISEKILEAADGNVSDSREDWNYLLFDYSDCSSVDSLDNFTDESDPEDEGL